MHPVFAQLTAATAARYRPAGHFAMNFVRGKLRYDPVYFALLTQGLLPAQGSLLDLGCGRGILMSLLSTARQWASQHGWPEEWACPPVDLRSYGVEIQPTRAAEARTALGSEAKVCVADLRCFDPLACHAVILLDVLQYLDYAAQDRLLECISNTLDRRGVLLIREVDARAGWRFRCTQLTERVCAAARGHWRQQYHYRSMTEWVADLEALDYRTSIQSMSQGTPFGNSLLVAHRSERCA
jgi:hypothetical protein